MDLITKTMTSWDYSIITLQSRHQCRTDSCQHCARWMKAHQAFKRSKTKGTAEEPPKFPCHTNCRHSDHPSGGISYQGIEKKHHYQHALECGHIKLKDDFNNMNCENENDLIEDSPDENQSSAYCDKNTKNSFVQRTRKIPLIDHNRGFGIQQEDDEGLDFQGNVIRNNRSYTHRNYNKRTRDNSNNQLLPPDLGESMEQQTSHSNENGIPKMVGGIASINSGNHNNKDF